MMDTLLLSILIMVLMIILCSSLIITVLIILYRDFKKRRTANKKIVMPKNSTVILSKHGISPVEYRVIYQLKDKMLFKGYAITGIGPGGIRTEEIIDYSNMDVIVNPESKEHQGVSK